MIRGTTPTHIFDLPFDTAVIKQIKIIYAQGDCVVFTKDAKTCHMGTNTVTVKLTQEETLMFDCRNHVQIQIRVLTLGGEALASDIQSVSVGKCLDNEVMV